jgi:hypothetical protein
MEIKQFNTANLKMLEASIDEALKPVAEKYGIQIKRLGGSFSPSDFRVRLECAVKNEDGTFETSERADFKLFAPTIGLSSSDLDTEFEYNEVKYKIIGMKTRSHKYPIIGERVPDGKRFKFPASAVIYHKRMTEMLENDKEVVVKEVKLIKAEDTN